MDENITKFTETKGIISLCRKKKNVLNFKGK